LIHYRSYRSVLRERFGAPVYKVSLNGGFSCPNRDGIKSTGGCLFCDNRSFSPAVAYTDVSAVQQLTALIEKKGSVSSGRLWLPYLQPFSNTYGSAARLREVYEPLLSVPGVIGIAIGTRPDCFTEDVYEYLEDLSRRTYVSIELGLQSSHDETLALCNRGHTWEDFCGAAGRLAACGIETVAHVMLGLPGEDAAMMRITAQRLAALPCSGVKIHQLMVIAGTEFEQWHRDGRLSVLEVGDYARLLCGFLSYLRSDQHIHRIIADSTVENGLVAPLWSADKNSALREIHGYMDEIGLVQGCCCEGTRPFAET